MYFNSTIITQDSHNKVTMLLPPPIILWILLCNWLQWSQITHLGWEVEEIGIRAQSTEVLTIYVVKFTNTNYTGANFLNKEMPCLYVPQNTTMLFVSIALQIYMGITTFKYKVFSLCPAVCSSLSGHASYL